MLQKGVGGNAHPYDYYYYAFRILNKFLHRQGKTAYKTGLRRNIWQTYKIFFFFFGFEQDKKFQCKKNRKNCTLLLLDQIIFEQDRMRLGIAKLKNFVFHLSLLSPFTIFATNKHPKKK